MIVPAIAPDDFRKSRRRGSFPIKYPSLNRLNFTMPSFPTQAEIAMAELIQFGVRTRLSTSPTATGSGTLVKTIRALFVARCAAHAIWSDDTRMSTEESSSPVRRSMPSEVPQRPSYQIAIGPKRKRDPGLPPKDIEVVRYERYLLTTTHSATFRDATKHRKCE